MAYDRALLWAERAQNEPLHISVWERPHRLEDFEYTEGNVDAAVDCLAPIMPCLCAMEFKTNGMGLNNLVSALLASWVKRGSIGTAKILKLDVPTCIDPVELGPKDAIILRSTPDKFEVFFRSLHTLSLANAKLDRRLGFYSGLVNLCLGEIGRRVSYSQWDTAAILAASPRLRSLSIIGLNIRIDTHHDGMPTAVALNDLHTLRLESPSPRNLWAVLRMITSTSDSIRMSLSFENHDEFLPAARMFFERCKVATLHIRSLYYQSRVPISSLFTHMPRLKILAIERCSIFDETWRGSTRPDGSSLDLWPQLDELYLTDCNLDQETLPRLVSIHAPRAIWIVEYGWDVEVGSQVERMLQRHAVKLIWFKNREDMPAQSQEIATGRFV